MPTVPDDEAHRFERERSRRYVRERLFRLPHRPTCIGRYELRRKVGEGGAGIVYAAYDPVVGREVALKRLTAPASRPEVLMREAKAAAQIAHPNVLTIYDVLEHQGETFIVSELTEGGTLRDWMRGAHDLDARVRMLRDIGAGVRAAHAAGLVHRDLKPENVLVDGDRPRIADFGIAASPAVHDRAVVGGTPQYSSPEQAAGAAPSPKNDQYSFALLGLELLTESPPERAAQEAALTSLGPRARRVAKVLRRGLATDPADRWLDMGALLDALDDAARRRWTGPTLLGVAMLVALAVGTAVAGAVAAFALSRPADPPTPPAGSPPVARHERADPSDTLYEAGAMMARGDLAGCAARLEASASDPRVRQAWAECADLARDVSSLRRACAAAREAADPAPRIGCGDAYLAALDAEDAGDPRRCASLLLEAPPV
ncbi:MAG: serine/threonine protein kinase, partial [Myxococcales bacterium]|nr:serine/threonine protein kinase [Myxococcales bacterium]